MINEELKEAVMRDLVLLSTVGIKVVLVHGGGPEINKALNAMKIHFVYNVHIHFCYLTDIAVLIIKRLAFYHIAVHTRKTYCMTSEITYLANQILVMSVR